MAKKTTAHRPSQSNQQYVKNSQGETVLNTAYQGKTTTEQSQAEDLNDFSFNNSTRVPPQEGGAASGLEV